MTKKRKKEKKLCSQCDSRTLFIFPIVRGWLSFKMFLSHASPHSYVHFRQLDQSPAQHAATVRISTVTQAMDSWISRPRSTALADPYFLWGENAWHWSAVLWKKKRVKYWHWYAPGTFVRVRTRFEKLNGQSPINSIVFRLDGKSYFYTCGMHVRALCMKLRFLMCKIA